MLHFCAIKSISKHNIILSLGSNIAPKKQYIEQAIGKIEVEIGFIISRSSLYQSSAWGDTNQNDFMNICVEISTNLSPYIVLYKLLEIEHDIGRIRNKKWGARIIDIDIIYFDTLIINTANLQIPHPEMHKRLFVLQPLEEINNKLLHPILKLNTNQLIKKCTDKGTVIVCE